MKILLIFPKIPYPPIDGHRISLFGVVKYLSLRGHQIDVIAYRQESQLDSFEELKKYSRIFILDVKTSNSVSGALINLFSNVPYNLWKYERKELKDFLKEYFRDNKPDIIQTTNTHMAWVIKELNKHSDAPKFLRLENLELKIMKRYYENERNPILKVYAFIQYKKFLYYEPYICSQFDNSILMSEEDQNELLKLNKFVSTSVIPVGVDENILSMIKSNVEEYSLAHIGSLVWYPNLDGINWFLETILPEIVKREPRTKLYLYGGGVSDSFKIDPCIKNNVVLKGFVEDIWHELLTKQIAIVPLRIGGGIRVKILEMAAAGQLIISTSVGAEGISLMDGKHLLIADSSAEFIDKIMGVFENIYDVSSIIENSKKEMAEKYTWQGIAKKFEEIYLKTIASKKYS